ncbi:MAG: radical SAM family heme chaperone HemW [Verrucomicrobiae bacterium]|nr:radical SAM family heme chaperone HemW [Verrucomicrobiae bacterium]
MEKLKGSFQGSGALPLHLVKHLYLHVPFCVRKCGYCAFASQVYSASEEKAFLHALEIELSCLKTFLLKPETIFIGGGTPSCLSKTGLEKLMHLLNHFCHSGLKEFSVEINPGSLDHEKARIFYENGINRVSMGVQSLNDRILSQLGRIHSAQQALHTFSLLRKVGFKNINLDVIFAVPGQSLDVFEATLADILRLKSEHLSCYELTYEEGTPLTRWAQETNFKADELLGCQMYDCLLNKALEAGFSHYEISNFSRPGKECLHNIAYWRGKEYYGAGPSACSLLKGVRYTHSPSLAFYCQSMEAEDSFHQNLKWNDWQEDVLSPLARAGEIAAIGLRMTRGWKFEEFFERTGYRLQDHWVEAMQKLCSQGEGEFFEGGFRLTSRGLRFADLAAEEFILLGV